MPDGLFHHFFSEQQIEEIFQHALVDLSLQEKCVVLGTWLHKPHLILLFEAKCFNENIFIQELERFLKSKLAWSTELFERPMMCENY